VRFVVDETLLEPGYLLISSLLPIELSFHCSLFICFRPPEVWDSSYQAAHYTHPQYLGLGLHLWVSTWLVTEWGS
jgi:hypothetical protein